jgi:hypothetical protein
VQECHTHPCCSFHSFFLLLIIGTSGTISTPVRMWAGQNQRRLETFENKGLPHVLDRLPSAADCGF